MVEIEKEIEFSRLNLLKCCEMLETFIVEGEMGGHFDKTDPFYSAYKQLQVLKEKLNEDDWD
jgi:hypothetical protein